jgi:NodT family efflux transporter outer membrane factor (OMF) lipoprotein
MKRQVLLSLLLATALSACTLTPDYKTPAAQAPQVWKEGDAQGDAAVARDWWKSFGSKTLDGLIDEALAHNNDILAGVQRVAQARAALKIAGASLLPAAQATAGAARDYSDPAGGGNRSASTSLRAGAGVSYELDLFGASRAGVEAARQNLAASGFDQDALALVVMGDVAKAYFTLLDAQERLRISDANLENAREILKIVQARFDAGSESALELSQQKFTVASREAARAAINGQIAAAENALSILLGRPPQSFGADEKMTDVAIPDVRATQPAALLSRRPDVAAAEAGLRAANADIGAARAALYPSLSIGLDGSIASAGFGDPASTAASLASSLVAPIFEGGRLQGGVEQAEAREKELAENYRKTALTAFREVEDALAASKSAAGQEASLAQALQEAQKSYDLSKARFDAGAVDFQTLLDTQNALLSAEDSHAQSRFDRLSAAVDLFKALGGGWQ